MSTIQHINKSLEARRARREAELAEFEALVKAENEAKENDAKAYMEGMNGIKDAFNSAYHQMGLIDDLTHTLYMHIWTEALDPTNAVARVAVQNAYLSVISAVCDFVEMEASNMGINIT